MSIKDDWKLFLEGIDPANETEFDEMGQLSVDLSVEDIMIALEYRLNSLKERSLGIDDDPHGTECRIDELEEVVKWIGKQRTIKETN